jgi:hypothetical protein
MPTTRRRKYDIVLRSLLRDGQSKIIHSLTGGTAATPLPVNFPRIRKVEYDLLYRIAANVIAHLEMQATNVNDIHLRSVDYAVPLWLEFLCEILQWVIYIGNRPLSMPKQQRLGNHILRVEIVDIRTFEADTLLASTFRADVVLAVLANNGARRVAEAIHQISQFPTPERANAILFLQELSGLRPELSLTIKKELHHMPVSLEELNLEENVFYQDAVAKGIRQGISQGISQGQRDLLLALLRQQFGKLPAWATKQIAVATSEEIMDWTLRAPTANSVAALLRRAR